MKRHSYFQRRRGGKDSRNKVFSGRTFRKQILRSMAAILGLAFWITWASTASAASKEENSGEEVLRATLDNGLRVVIVRNTLAPVITTIVNYLVGSDEAPEGFPGMAHAQEHMMFRGSPGLSANQLADIIAAMGGMFNADTQQAVTQYFLTAPAEDLGVALNIEAIRMRGVLDSEKLWEQERGRSSRKAPRIYPVPSMSSTRNFCRPCSRERRTPTLPWERFPPSIGQPEPCSRSFTTPGMHPTMPFW